jgi:uncharacterized lipoprotein (TIGR02269 family)
MRHFLALWSLSLLLGCSSVTPAQQQWEAAEPECTEHGEDVCVTLLCGDDACGFYRCEDVPGGVELARLPPVRPPPAAAAPGSGPERNWGDRMRLPGGGEPVMVFPWHGTPKPVPPNRQLTAGRFEKHHIFPQASDRATTEEIFKHAGELIYRFQLLGGPIQKYN